MGREMPRNERKAPPKTATKDRASSLERGREKGGGGREGGGGKGIGIGVGTGRKEEAMHQFWKIRRLFLHVIMPLLARSGRQPAGQVRSSGAASGSAPVERRPQ